METILGVCERVGTARMTSGTGFRISGSYLRVYPLHAPALCIPLHSRYIRRSRSARDSSEALRWYVTLLTPFFFAGCAVAVLLSEVELLAETVAGQVSMHRAIAQVDISRDRCIREDRVVVQAGAKLVGVIVGFQWVRAGG